MIQVECAIKTRKSKIERFSAPSLDTRQHGLYYDPAQCIHLKASLLRKMRKHQQHMIYIICICMYIPASHHNNNHLKRFFKQRNWAKRKEQTIRFGFNSELFCWNGLNEQHPKSVVENKRQIIVAVDPKRIM